MLRRWAEIMFGRLMLPIMIFYAALVGLGLYKDLLAAVVGVLVVHAFAWRPWKKLMRLLDTTTPGGLADVVAALRHSHSPPQIPGQGEILPDDTDLGFYQRDDGTNEWDPDRQQA